MRDLELEDDWFKSYFRLSKAEFDEALSITDEDVTKKDSN